MIVNLTPHRVVVIFDDSLGRPCVREFPPSGQIARVAVSTVPDGMVEGVPVVRTVFGQVENLPKPQDGVFFIVSSIVAQAVRGREDVLAPDTGPESAIRDEDGRITAVRRLARL